MRGWIEIDTAKVLSYVDSRQFTENQKRIPELHQQLHSKTGLGNDFLGWLDLPASITPNAISILEDLAQDFRSSSSSFVHLGIGGSYLGARSAIEFYQTYQPAISNPLIIHFAGIDLSPASIYNLFKYLDDKDICLNVISKSGSTLETSVAFDLCLQYMKKRYISQDLKKRIIITTDPCQGALLQFAQESGFRTLPINTDIGGRYSVLTAVGLFPMAVMGLPIHSLIKGATQAQHDLSNVTNSANTYALLRQSLPVKQFMIEAFATFEPSLRYFTEWWKQLFGESLGKDHKGLFPVDIHYSTDLHAHGQYLQEGRRILLETFLTIDSLPKHLSAIRQSGKSTSLSMLNEQAMKATMAAHSEGGLPCLSLSMKDTSLFALGYLYYFMMKACAMSGYLSGVNPFNQPGVEKYKAYMRQQTQTRKRISSVQ